MKTFKLVPIAAFCLTAAMLLSSCGIMKNTDFSSQKYTNFKKGEAAINYKKTDNEKKEVASNAFVSNKKEISDNSSVTTNEPSQAVLNSVQKNKIESGNKENSNYINPKGTEKNKISRSLLMVKNRLHNESTTSTENGGDTGLIILVILAIFLPPLSVFLARGLGNEFWLDLLLTILFWVPGVIYALLIAFDAI
jgi:uncharacterized membrane protein YqaE (UPF0057 family)